MNLRHAAALALVGWYLMSPPIQAFKESPVPELSAPLSQWTSVSAFDTAQRAAGSP